MKYKLLIPKFMRTLIKGKFPETPDSAFSKTDEAIIFRDGEFKTSNPELIEALEKHPKNKTK